ncbi:hypothetical protein [Ferrimicrobium sp.]|uniref:hypothetical protein n=1 Tax=Ferrimicrobium sp. TaxID=2926050 RepID=UPI00261A8365|nr:hypothetical protein [Ferrimicrobium sp.]
MSNTWRRSIPSSSAPHELRVDWLVHGDLIGDRTQLEVLPWCTGLLATAAFDIALALRVGLSPTIRSGLGPFGLPL